MKFTINKSTLLDALSITGKGISQKAVIPILADYLFKIDGNSLNVTGGSEGFFVSKNLEITGGLFSKAIAIPATKLQSIIKKLPDQPLEFFVTETKEGKVTSMVLKIKSSTGDYNIPVENGDDYPQMPVTELSSFEVELAPLLSSINKTIFACSVDDLRPALTGINISFKDNNALLVGCNGAMISISSLPVEFKHDKNLIVPTRILSVLQQLSSGDKVKISIGERNIQITDSSGIELKSLLIDENYVDYEPIIPIQHEKHVVVNGPQLIAAINRVSLFAEIGNDVFKISFSKGKCILSAKNTLGEHASEELTIQYDGDDISFGASGKQFTNCLSKLDKEEANIMLNDPNKAIIIVDDPSTITLKKDLILVMPFRLPF